jgi:hypothetical protein
MAKVRPAGPKPPEYSVPWGMRWVDVESPEVDPSWVHGHIFCYDFGVIEPGMFPTRRKREDQRFRLGCLILARAKSLLDEGTYIRGSFESPATSGDVDVQRRARG